MGNKEILVAYGLTLLGPPLGYLCGGPTGMAVAGVLGVACLVAAYKRRADDEEEFEDNRMFNEPIAWAEPPVPARKPRLVWKAFQFVDATLDKDSGIWRERWEQYSTKAFVFHFTNELYDSGGGEPATVKAQLAWEYRNGVAGVTFSPGAWMDEPCGLVEIPVGWSKKLIIGVRVGSPGMFYWEGYSNPRITIKDVHRLDGQPLPIDGFVIIKLIGPTNELWYQGKFAWTEDVNNQSHPGIQQLA